LILRSISSCEFGIPIVLGALAFAFASAPDMSWVRAPTTEEKSFKSPDAGIASLAGAVRKNDLGALSAWIGDSCSAAVIDFRGPKTVTNMGAGFADGSRTKAAEQVTVSLRLGDDELPLHLLKTNGAWQFDAAESCDQLLSRRINDNESSAMRASREFAGGRRQTVSVNSGMISRRATARDGYYYRLVAGPASKRDHGVGEPARRHDTALVAYPASYGVSGVMTFVVDQGGKIYKKDLGSGTVLAILELEDFHADSTWQPVKTVDAVLLDVPVSSRRHDEVSSVPAVRRLEGTRTVAAQ
jgi:DUF2950 family protein